MSFALSDFWAFFDFCLAQTIELFTLLDGVVVVESPRFSLFNFMISIIFLTLLMETINWLRGAHGSGGTNWQYIMRDRPTLNQWSEHEKENFELDLFMEELRNR